jgi:hypothetical protein
MAYMTLRADAATNTDLATKLNVIVLFTDGIPNGITAFANDKNLTTKYGKNFMMGSTSGCSSSYLGAITTYSNPLVSSTSKNLIGWFNQGGGNASGNHQAPYGLNEPMMGYACYGSQCGNNTGFTGRGDDIDAYMKFPKADTYQIPQWGAAGCSGASPMAGGTMVKFPDYDLYGNYIDLSGTPPPMVNGLTMPTGSTGKLYEQGTLWSTPTQCNKASFNPATTTDACQVGLASWQAAAHQAWKIWNQIVWDKTTQQNIADPGPNLAQPIIYTIGFASTATDLPDMKLLQMIANDPLSPVPFCTTRPRGEAFYAKDPNAVSIAFQQIASEILRLSQ